MAALSEISDVSTSAAEALELNSQTVNKLCTALNECTEYVDNVSFKDLFKITREWGGERDSLHFSALQEGWSLKI